MKILVIGANGYLGSAVTTALAFAGHEVVRAGRARAGEDGDPNYRILDLSDPASIVSATTPDLDAVVHAGAPLGDWAADRAAVSALLSQLRGRERRLVYVSGAWVLGPSTSSPLDEQSPPRPISLVSGRESVEKAVLTSRARGVVIRPGIVHGHGGGIPSLMTGWAAESGHGRYVAESSDARPGQPSTSRTSPASWVSPSPRLVVATSCTPWPSRRSMSVTSPSPPTWPRVAPAWRRPGPWRKRPPPSVPTSPRLSPPANGSPPRAHVSSAGRPCARVWSRTSPSVPIPAWHPCGVTP